MSRCRCTPTGPECGYCQARIDAAEEARAGRPRGYSDRELDHYADAAAAREWGVRDY